MSLDSKTNQFAIVINSPTRDKFNDDLLRACFDEYFEEWSYILHDKDTDDNGLFKTLHYHVVAKSKRQRLLTVISKISNYLHISPLCIQIDKANSYVGSLQYLIHKNDIDKFQYNIDDICTSMTRENLELSLSVDYDAISIEKLINLITRYDSLSDIITSIGLTNYVSYRNVIKDLWNERYNIRARYEKSQDNSKDNLEKLPF